MVGVGAVELASDPGDQRGQLPGAELVEASFRRVLGEDRRDRDLLGVPLVGGQERFAAAERGFAGFAEVGVFAASVVSI